MRKRGARVLGPYEEPNGRWRVVTVRADGIRQDQVLPTRAEAVAVVEAGRATAESIGRTVGSAIDEYERFLIAKGNKPKSYTETIRRLRLFFHDAAVLLEDMTQARCRALYARLADAKRDDGTPLYKPDSHRNYLAEARSFLRWCVEVKHWIRRNGLEGVQGQGRRSHGKVQLRIDEARAWEALAYEYVAQGEAGALGALMALYMDMRASEIVGMKVRDLDDNGRVVWVDRIVTKTDAGRRALDVPDDPPEFREALLHLASQRCGEELLFPAERGESGGHWRDWIARWSYRICDQLGLPRVCAHGLRGTHASFAMARGATPRDVAESLGHKDKGQTVRRSYSTAEATAKGQQVRSLRVLRGGVQARKGVSGDRCEPENAETAEAKTPAVSDS